MSHSFLIKNALVYDSNSRAFYGGAVLINDGMISACIKNGEPLPAADRVIDAAGDYLIPGLIDIHSHGRIGFDFDSATEEEMREMRVSYANDGTTTVLPTVASAPFAQIEEAIVRIKAADFDGWHLEGRYLNEKRRGAHKASLLALPNIDELSRLLDLAGEMHTHITCAAELGSGDTFVKYALSRGATVSLGHTDATYEEAMESFALGVTASSHTFNAMPPLHHRTPGATAAALTNEDVYCEIIADGFHIAPAMVKLAYLAKPSDKLVLVSDSMSATNCKDGTYAIAGETVYVKDGKAVNVEGAIAGSTTTLFLELKNLMEYAGVSFEDAIPCVTSNAAKLVHLDHLIGKIKDGLRADLLLISKDSMKLRAVFASGKSPKEAFLKTL